MCGEFLSWQNYQLVNSSTCQLVNWNQSSSAPPSCTVSRLSLRGLCRGGCRLSLSLPLFWIRCICTPLSWLVWLRCSGASGGWMAMVWLRCWRARSVCLCARAAAIVVHIIFMSFNGLCRHSTVCPVCGVLVYVSRFRWCKVTNPATVLQEKPRFSCHFATLPLPIVKVFYISLFTMRAFFRPQHAPSRHASHSHAPRQRAIWARAKKYQAAAEAMWIWYFFDILKPRCKPASPAAKCFSSFCAAFLWNYVYYWYSTIYNDLRNIYTHEKTRNVALCLAR